MTFRPPDCPQCRNSGYYLRAIFPPEPLTVCTELVAPPLEPHTIERVACDCWHGQQYQIFLDRSSHPEYVNPFLNMSDEEILENLSRTSDTQRLIDSEFE